MTDMIPIHHRTNMTGELSFLEAEKDIPFPIKRVYYIYNVDPKERRGFHAHKALEQVLICTSGSCKVLCDDGRDKRIFELNDPAMGLYIGKLEWHEMFDFIPGTVLLVLASDYYNESDYIRNYDNFLEYLMTGAEI